MTDSAHGFRVTTLARLRMKDAWRLELLHSQPHHRFFWITRGQGRVTIRGVTRGYGPHTAIFLPKGAQMGIELGPQMQGIALVLPDAPVLGLPQRPVQRRVATLEGQTSLIGHLERIERELAAHAPAMERALLGYGLLISAWLTRETVADDGMALREKSHHLAEAFADALEARFRSGEGVAEYARALGVTPTHLSRVCRDAAGRPALALLNERIMHEARRLLRDTDMPAREIAETLGFSSAAYFTRAFQQATKLSPIAYRTGA